jgi:hypothetical protein
LRDTEQLFMMTQVYLWSGRNLRLTRLSRFSDRARSQVQKRRYGSSQ